MAFLLTFIHNGGILKVTRFKNGNIFLVTKVFQKGYNVQMSLCVSLTWYGMSRDGQRQCSVSVYTDLLAFRRFLFLIVRGEAARQRVAKHREKNEVSRASNREHGFSWVFEERTSGARVLDMGKRSRKGAYKAITPLYLKVFNHWKKKRLTTRKPKVWQLGQLVDLIYRQHQRRRLVTAKKKYHKN